VLPHFETHRSSASVSGLSEYCGRIGATDRATANSSAVMHAFKCALSVLVELASPVSCHRVYILWHLLHAKAWPRVPDPSMTTIGRLKWAYTQDVH